MSVGTDSGQARQFASREYLHALYKGDRMTPEERTKAMADLSRLTGLQEFVVINNDLRITLERYNTELMREEHEGLLTVRCARQRLHSDGRWRARRRRWWRPWGTRRPVRAVDFNESNLAGGFASAYDRLSSPRSDLHWSQRRDLLPVQRRESGPLPRPATTTRVCPARCP